AAASGAIAPVPGQAAGIRRAAVTTALQPLDGMILPGGPQAAGPDTRKVIRTTLATVDDAQRRTGDALKAAGELLGVVGTRPLARPELGKLGSLIAMSRAELKTALEHLDALETLLAAKGKGMPESELLAAKKALAAVKQELTDRAAGLERLGKLLHSKVGATELSVGELEALKLMLADLKLARGDKRGAAEDHAGREAQIREAQKKQHEQEEKLRLAARRTKEHADEDRSRQARANHHDREGQAELSELYDQLIASRKAESLRRLEEQRERLAR
ncbi:MAG: hypothetical protein FJZ01_08915, partial [Candidatus Sericytochromatia bacterium]|nr:hypothetical protein [Candidatus Tanganyikabacteria bacterium]